MSDLPALPSSMQNAEVAANNAGANALALTTPAALTVKLDGPQFQARKLLPPAEAKTRQDFAAQLVRDPKFDALWLANFTRKLDLDTGPLDEVLTNTRALNAGDVADLSINATQMMNKANKQLPKPPDPKFLRAYQSGVAKANDIYNIVRWLSGQIQRFLMEYQNMEVPFVKIVAQLQAKYDLMVTAVVLNEQLAKNEDARTKTLTEDTALLEYALIALPDRVKELQAQSATDPEATKKEISRLVSLEPLVQKSIMTLNPMIFTGNAAVGRYPDLSNMAGGRAVVLGLFLSAGIARWKSDVVTELQTMNQLAVGLAMSSIDEFMNPQAARASGAFVEAAQDYMTLMNAWITKAETMQKIADDIEKAHDILVTGARQLSQESQKTAVLVEQAKERIDTNRDKFNNEMLQIAQQSAAQQS